MRGERGSKYVCFCQCSGYKNCPHRGRGVKQWQNSAHVVVKCPLIFNIYGIILAEIIFEYSQQEKIILSTTIPPKTFAERHKFLRGSGFFFPVASNGIKINENSHCAEAREGLQLRCKEKEQQRTQLWPELTRQTIKKGHISQINFVMYRVGKAKLFQVSNFFVNHHRVYLLSLINRHGCLDHGGCAGQFFSFSLSYFLALIIWLYTII